MAKSSKKATVKMTFEWEFSEKEWQEHKDWIKDSGKRFDGDPITLWYFLCDVSWPTLLRKSVERSA